MECPKYKEERKVLIRALPEQPGAVQLSQLLALDDEITRSAVLDFLEKTGISHRLRLDATALKAGQTNNP